MTVGEVHHLSELVSMSLKGAGVGGGGGVGLDLPSTLSHPRIIFSRKPSQEVTFVKWLKVENFEADGWWCGRVC